MCFVYNATAPPEIYTLSLHDALPILLRIGGDADGSYLVPDDLHGVSACFSPGVNKIKYFEDYLTDRYGIECHMCDFSDRKSTRLNSSHVRISYAVFCLKKKKYSLTHY